MLDKDLLEQVKSIFADLKNNYRFEISCNPALDDSKQMIEFFTDFSTASPHLSVTVNKNNSDKAVTMFVRDDVPTGISFRCIPGGHEFTSLLLAVLNADGKGKNLPDDTLAARIKGLKGDIALTTYMSLECTNCPDVVQALNVMALYNDRISSEIVDGNMAVAEVDALGVKSVPTVYANGEVLQVGKSSLGELLEKLEEKFGSEGVQTEHAPRSYDAIVLGGGPAGAASAIYLSRKGLRVAVVAKTVGGQVKETVGIDNLISKIHTTGEQLASDLRQHMQDYPVEIFDNRSIETADVKSEIKSVVTKGGEIFEAPQVIIATGASWRRLGVPGENDYIGKGVAFCVHCDGPFYKGKDVAVVGGGNSGIEAAIDLAAICPHVDVFEFLDTLKADNVLQDKVKSLPNVIIHLSSAVKEVMGDSSKVTGLKVEDRLTGKVSDYALSGVFVQIGLTANSEPFRTQLATTRAGEIQIDEFCRTDVPGVYAAGDCTNVPYKQIVIAMGEGAKAALTLVDDCMRSGK